MRLEIIEKKKKNVTETDNRQTIFSIYNRCLAIDYTFFPVVRIICAIRIDPVTTGKKKKSKHETNCYRSILYIVTMNKNHHRTHSMSFKLNQFIRVFSSSFLLLFFSYFELSDIVFIHILCCKNHDAYRAKFMEFIFSSI